MFKKFLSFALCGIMLVSLSACSNGKETAQLNSEYVTAVKDAAAKLNSTYTDYIVTTTLEAPDGDTQYLEVKHEDTSYTEYSVSDDNEVGTIAYGSSDSITYSLTDWLTKDGKYYMFGSDNDGKSVTYSLPTAYNDLVSDRVMLYANKFVDNALSIEKYDDLTLNLGDGSQTYTSYKVKVPASVVKDVLGVSTYGVYKTIEDDKDTSANIKKLCSYYLEDLDMNLTFSDANVILGIDSDGILKYACLEVGGLGTRLYYTKAVVATKNSNVRSTPDFTNAQTYASSLSDLADYVADYDSYDEAVKALNEKSSLANSSTESSTETTTESEESTTETNK
jgi:hypothetical protein